MRYPLLAVACLVAACSSPVAPEAAINLPAQAESWRVTEWLADDARRVWECTSVRIHQSGALVCLFTDDGFALLRSGTYEVRPGNRAAR